MQFQNNGTVSNYSIKFQNNGRYWRYNKILDYSKYSKLFRKKETYMRERTELVPTSFKSEKHIF